jgi:hypothetical protein
MRLMCPYAPLSLTYNGVNDSLLLCIFNLLLAKLVIVGTF